MLERTKKRRTDDQQQGYIVETKSDKSGAAFSKKHGVAGHAVTVRKEGKDSLRPKGIIARSSGVICKNGVSGVVKVEAEGSCGQIRRLTIYAKSIGIKLKLKDELVSLETAMPEMINNRPGVCLRGGRTKEDMSQMKLSALTGISQRHISEMENGKRPIGKETAKKLGDVLNIDYRVFL